MAVLSELGDEMRRAEDRYGPFTSAHEGYGVLAEEMAELLWAIRANASESVRTEAIQVAAVALRIARACRDSAAFRERSGFDDGSH